MKISNFLHKLTQLCNAATVIQKHSLMSGYKVCAGKKTMNYRVYLTENNTGNNFKKCYKKMECAYFCHALCFESVLMSSGSYEVPVYI